MLTDIAMKVNLQYTVMCSPDSSSRNASTVLLCLHMNKVLDLFTAAQLALEGLFDLHGLWLVLVVL